MSGQPGCTPPSRAGWLQGSPSPPGQGWGGQGAGSWSGRGADRGPGLRDVTAGARRGRGRLFFWRVRLEGDKARRGAGLAPWSCCPAPCCGNSCSCRVSGEAGVPAARTSGLAQLGQNCCLSLAGRGEAPLQGRDGAGGLTETTRWRPEGQRTSDSSSSAVGWGMWSPRAGGCGQGASCVRSVGLQAEPSACTSMEKRSGPKEVPENCGRAGSVPALRGPWARLAGR